MFYFYLSLSIITIYASLGLVVIVTVEARANNVGHASPFIINRTHHKTNLACWSRKGEHLNLRQ